MTIMSDRFSKCTLFGTPTTSARGWHLHSHNDDIDGTAEIMAPSFATGYAQLAADDTVACDSDQAGDTTQSMYVYGIDSNGRKVNETIALNGTTEVDGSLTFSYIENIWTNALSAGIMSLKRTTGDTYIMEVEAGLLNSGIAQHFNGEDQSYITFFAAGLSIVTDDALFELRWYPDDSSCRGTSTGYEVLDRLFCTTEVSNTPPHRYPMPIGPLPAGGWIVVYATAAAANAGGWCTVQGFDVGA